MTTDKLVHIPEPQTLPPLGGSIVDGMSGVTLKRCTDAVRTQRPDGGGLCSYIAPEYSMSAFNCDCSYLLLEAVSSFMPFDGHGQFIRNLPLEINASCEPRWSTTDPNAFYYHAGNQLKKFSVSANAGILIYTFIASYISFGKGEGDISADGDHLPIICDGHLVSLFTISTKTQGRVFDTQGYGNIDSAYVSADNQVLIAWGTNGAGHFQGEELYDGNMVYLRKISFSDGHKAMAVDVDGRAILVRFNAADNPYLPGFPNSVEKVILATGEHIGLFDMGDLEKWTDAVHISAGPGFAMVSTYVPQTVTLPYQNELIQVPYTPGQPINRVAHHRSIFSDYESEAWPSVSRDGSRCVYGSNFNGAPNSPVDAWILFLAGAPVPPPPPPPSVRTVTGMGQLVSGFARVDTGLTQVTEFFTSLLYRGHPSEFLSIDFPNGGSVDVWSSIIKSGPGHNFYWQAVGK